MNEKPEKYGPKPEDHMAHGGEECWFHTCREMIVTAGILDPLGKPLMVRFCANCGAKVRVK